MEFLLRTPQIAGSVKESTGNSLATDVQESSIDLFVPASAQEQQVEAQQGSLQALDFAWIVWGKRRWLFRTSFIGLVLFTIIAFSIPKRYTATTRLMPPDYNTGSMMSLAALPAMSGGSGGSGGSGVMGLASQLLGMNSSGDLFVGVLQSWTVEDNIIRRFGLMDVYSTRYIEDARKKLEAVTEIAVDKKTEIIVISVEDKSPQRAAEMAQAYVDVLNQTLAEVNTSTAHRERVFVETRLKEVKQELDNSSKEFSVFSSQNSAIDVPEQAKAMVGAAADLQAQVIAAQSQLKGLQQIFTDDAIQVRQVKAQIAELQTQIDKFGGKDVNVTKDTSLAKGELYPSVRQLPLLGVKYLDLYRKIKTEEAVYELLTKQYEIARIQEAREVPTAQVLDAAVVPSKKSYPHRGQIIIGGLLLTFVTASAWILIPVLWSRTDPHGPKRVFAEAVLETVKRRTWNSRLGRWSRNLLKRSDKLRLRSSGGRSEI